MASIIDTTRIVDLPTKASLSEGDVFVVDNENGATSKIPASAVSGSSTAGLVAEEYRDSRTYKVGEYCIHVEAGIPKFYKCTTEIATAESWTPAHWEGTDAGTEITDLNQNLTIKSKTFNVNTGGVSQVVFEMDDTGQIPIHVKSGPNDIFSFVERTGIRWKFSVGRLTLETSVHNGYFYEALFNKDITITVYYIC